MLHHMMRVIRDLGALAGMEFAPGRTTAEAGQPSLFEDVEEPVK